MKKIVMLAALLALAAANVCAQTNTELGNVKIDGTATFPNHNAMFWAGPGATPTIDQAVASCGANPCWVEISPLYTGPESANLIATSLGFTVYSGALNVTIVDRRGSVAGGGVNYPVLYGARLAGQLVRMGVNGWSSSPADSTGASTSINWVQGTMPTNGGTQNGSVSVVISHDTVNVGTGNVPWVGQDGECDITATVFDFPVNNCYGTNGQANIVRANGAQSIINAVGQHAAVNSNVSTSAAQMINSYGALNEAQSAGVGRNYAEYNRGNALFDTETQIHSLITGANVTITAATESTQIVTITTSGVCTFTTNQEVAISGVTPAAYNGRYFVRSPGCNGGSTFTYFHPSSASLGAGTVFGIVNGLTPQSTTYFRNTNRIDHSPLADAQGWVWLTQAGASAFRILPASIITSFVPHEFAARQILDEIAAPSGSATQDLVWGDSGDHFLKYNPNNQGEQHVPQAQILTSAYTNATTGFTTVTGGQTFSFPVKANTNYVLDCHLYYQAAATGGLNIQFTGPAAPTQLRYAINAPLSAGANNTATASAFSTSLGAVVTTATTDFDAAVTLGLVNGANAGTVTLQAKSSAAVNLTIQPGSYCQVQ